MFQIESVWKDTTINIAVRGYDKGYHTSETNSKYNYRLRGQRRRRNQKDETMETMSENPPSKDAPKTVNVPDHVGLEGLEEKFSTRLEEYRVYAFDPNTSRE